MKPVGRCTLVIFCPLAFERAWIERAVGVRPGGRGRGGRGGARAAGGAAIHVIQTGPGPLRVREAVERAVEQGPIGALRPGGDMVVAVLAGVAGELAPAGGAHVFSEVISAEGERWRSTLADAGLGRNGNVILGLNGPAFTPDDKSRWRERSGAMLVDTESHSFAEACSRHAVPWLVVRAASDQRHESLPARSVHWVDARGDTRLRQVLADLVRSPALLPAVINLGRRGANAMRDVGARVRRLASEELACLAEDSSRAPAEPAEAGPPIAPLPAEVLSAPLLIVFGGSFDPPHAAHVRLPRLVRDELERRAGCVGRAYLVYVPAARSPLKSEAPIAADEHRAAMLRLGLADVPRAVVWNDELERRRRASEAGAIFVNGGAGAAPRQAESPHGAADGAGTDVRGVPASYTVTTIERLRALVARHGRRAGRESGTVLRLLIGADQAKQFHRWKDARRVIELAEPVVMLRAEPVSEENGGRVEAAEALSGLLSELAGSGEWSPAELRAWGERVIELPMLEHRSTNLREALSRRGSGIAAPGDGEQAVEALLDPRVRAYIDEHGLYRESR